MSPNTDVKDDLPRGFHKRMVDRLRKGFGKERFVLLQCTERSGIENERKVLVQAFRDNVQVVLHESLASFIDEFGLRRLKFQSVGHLDEERRRSLEREGQVMYPVMRSRVCTLPAVILTPNKYISTPARCHGHLYHGGRSWEYISLMFFSRRTTTSGDNERVETRRTSLPGPLLHVRNPGQEFRDCDNLRVCLRLKPKT